MEEILAKIRKSTPYISGVTISGGEPTLQHVLDLKASNDERHQELTGNSNTAVLDSIQYLAKMFQKKLFG